MKFVSHIKSYVKRNGRITTSQKTFLKKKEYDNNFFIISKKNLNYKELFKRSMELTNETLRLNKALHYDLKHGDDPNPIEDRKIQ